MKKSVIRIICFLVVLAVVLGRWNDIFRFKYSDGIYCLDKFYEEKKDTVDVLILGTSHAFENINTGTLWDEYGISSFILAGAFQPMWNSYYYLKEALKTQKPKLIVLEAYNTVFSLDYIENAFSVKSNFGLKWSKNKIDSILTSTPEGNRVDYVLEYTQYHNRYMDLSAEDFLEEKGDKCYYEDWKGFGCNFGIQEFEVKDVSAVTDCAEMNPKTEKYYRSILDLAQEKNIPILVVVAPYAGISEYDQSVFNSAKKIAEEKEIDFINYNLMNDEIGLNYSTDIADEAHLNHRGSSKFTKCLGRVMADKYNIPNHKGDSMYDSWERHAKYLRAYIHDQELRGYSDIEKLMDECHSSEYRLFISVDGGASIDDSTIRSELIRYGLPETEVNGTWVVEENKVIWNYSEETKEYYNISPSRDFYMTRRQNADGSFYGVITIDNMDYQKVGDGVNVLIFDKTTDCIVTSFGLDRGNNYSVVW